MFIRHSVLAVFGFALSMCICFLSTAYAQVSKIDLRGVATYTNDRVDVAVFLDAYDASLVSYGVKLTYDPDDLTVQTAEKNEEVWYFGTQADKRPYMAPETDTPGVVVILGGKLDTDSPDAGVSGNDILLGRVSFVRKNTNIPTLALALGRAGEYRNFVTTGNRVLDDQVSGLGAIPVQPADPAPSPAPPPSPSGGGGGGGCFLQGLLR